MIQQSPKYDQCSLIYLDISKYFVLIDWLLLNKLNFLQVRWLCNTEDNPLAMIKLSKPSENDRIGIARRDAVNGKDYHVS